MVEQEVHFSYVFPGVARQGGRPKELGEGLRQLSQERERVSLSTLLVETCRRTAACERSTQRGGAGVLVFT